MTLAGWIVTIVVSFLIGWLFGAPKLEKDRAGVDRTRTKEKARLPRMEETRLGPSRQMEPGGS